MSTSSHSPDACSAGFGAIIGQQRQTGMLIAALQKNKVPHAMLFTGEEGIGKKTTATNFAMACNCKSPLPSPVIETSDTKQHGVKDSHTGTANGITKTAGNFNPCGKCRPCRKIASGNHPDFHRIEPSGAYIKIEQIRRLCGFLSLKPHEASVRFVLLADAHLMNSEAGNSLLKVLEEPPEKTVFILIAPQAADILPTIVSRCRQIRFNPIPEDELEAYLVKRSGLKPENAMVIASLAGGSIGRALAIKDDGRVIGHRNRIIEEVELVLKKTAGYEMFFAETLARDKERLGLALEIIKTWLRDLAVSKSCPDKICNRDLKAKLLELGKHTDINSLIDKTNAVCRAERAIKANANTRLAMEALAIKLAE